MGVKNKKNNTYRQTGDRKGHMDDSEFILANRRNRRQAKRLGILGEAATEHKKPRGPVGKS